MALLFLDSFDHYVTADLPDKYPITANATIVPATGRRGTASLHCSGSSSYYVQPALAPTDPTTVIIGVAVKPGGNPVGVAEIIDIYFSNSIQCSLAILVSGAIAVYRGSQLTLLGTSATGVVPVGAYAYVELKAVVHTTAGSMIVRVNEATVLTVTGVNTAQTAVNNWGAVRILGSTNLSAVDYDDLYICDGSGPAPRNDFLGDCRVDVRLPTAQGTSHAWTPTPTVDNALNVDDPAPDDDTTYNATTTVGATDTLIVQDAAVAGGTIFGVQVCLNQRKSDAGTCTIVPVVRHAGVDYPGAGLNPGTTYAYGLVPLGTNPGTGAAWVEADFNAAEFGYKRTA